MPHTTLHPPGKVLFFAGLTLALVLAGAATYHRCFMQRQASVYYTERQKPLFFYT